MTSKYSEKSNSKTNIKKSSGSTIKPALYKASLGGRARLTLSKKYKRHTAKQRKFELLVQLIERQHKPGLSDTERTTSANFVTIICQRCGIDLQEVLDEVQFRKNKYNTGSSIVVIKHNDKGNHSPMRTQTYLIEICEAIEMKHNVCAFTNLKTDVLELTFYGCATATRAAQLEFKNVYDYATKMGQSYKGNGQRNSYLLGVAAGLWDRAMCQKVAIEKEIVKARKLAGTTFVNEDLTINETDQPSLDLASGSSQESSQAIVESQTAMGHDGCNGRNPTGRSHASMKHAGDGNGQEDENTNSMDRDDNNEEKNVARGWVRNVLFIADHLARLKKAARVWCKNRDLELEPYPKSKKNISYSRAFEEGKKGSRYIEFSKKICSAAIEDI